MSDAKMSTAVLTPVASMRIVSSRIVVRTLTHAVRYETVSTMITSGRGDELVAAHSKLLEILRGHEGEDVEEIVRGTYFGDIIHGEEK